jgi:agmatinase
VSGPPYRPVDAHLYPRFAGIRTFMRLPHVTELAGVDFAVVGVPFDTATSFRAGARNGPEAIRSVSALLRPYHRVHDIDIFSVLSGVDLGDLPVVPGNVQATYERIEEGLAPLVKRGVFPLVLGGDHSITLAELRALARRHGPLALVQLDAHDDTWDAYFGERYFHGTTFRRAAEEAVVDPQRSTQAGMRGPLYGAADVEHGAELGFCVVAAEELRALGPKSFAAEVRERASGRPVFLSFDVDFLDPAYAPGTGTPEVGGFTTAEALAYIRALTDLDLVGFDCVEVSPSYDGPGQVTALAAANIVWEVIVLRALAAQTIQRGRRRT